MEPIGTSDSVVRMRLLGLICLFVCSGVVVAFSFLYTRDTPLLRVVFFDVGQGDAIFIESPAGTQVLVDAGRDRSVLRNLSREMHFFDRTIDMIVMTHEDMDHAGGMPELFSRYTVDTFLRTENQGESFVADEVDDVMHEEGSEIIYARSGMTFDLGGGVVLSVLFPDRDPSFLDSNTSSIILELTYGEQSFLLTGDAPQEIEEYLVDRNLVREVDVLKLGHHGSRTSTSPRFLDAVRPLYAIVSAGKDNSYGHPHEEVTTLLKERNIPILNTAEDGSIGFLSDGNVLVLEE